VGFKEITAYVKAYAEATDSGYGPGETCVCHSKYTRFLLLYPQPVKINASNLEEESAPQQESEGFNVDFWYGSSNLTRKEADKDKEQD
jgi:hypothetical protein